MTRLYCSKGHDNPSTNLYCQLCGEQLSQQPTKTGIYPGAILGDRYRIVRLLGQGGFGRTYLAEDINRFQEPCVLKEFAPQVRGTYAQQKAEQLFEREAGTLYKLQHPQIPKFRELFRAKIDDKGYLFLVQDYVDGQTYRSLLDARKRQGQRFNEMEVQQFLLQLLPVLNYVHSLGVIHRDISPDNLILRSADWMPILIDFGGVKEVAAQAESQFTQSAPNMTPHSGTRLGKIGYAPNEQMQIGVVYPHSDLYALAATALVLLTGKEPQQLIDQNNLTWTWRREINISPNLGAILDRMLSYRPGDRFQSAREVMQALGATPPPTPAPAPPTVPPTRPASPPPQPNNKTAATIPVAPPLRRQDPTPPPVISTPSNNETGRNMTSLLLTCALVVGLAGAGVAGIGWMINSISGMFASRPQPTETPTASPKPDPEPSPDSQLPPEEIRRKQALRDKRRNLGIDYNFYVNLVNEIFWNRNPNLRGKTLSDDPSDATLRTQWDKIANETLDKLDFLSANARQRLGSYSKADRDRFKAQVNEKYVGSRSLFDMADAEFFYRFGEQENFIDKPIGQVWYAIAFDKVSAIESGKALQRIVFPSGETGKTVSGTLQPGGSIVYIAGLAEGQQMRVNVDADRRVLLSVYPPTTAEPAFLEDSTRRTLSRQLTQKGFYEFVLVSKGSRPLNYTLNVSAENIAPAPDPTPEPAPEPTSSPSPTPTPTATETPSPSPSPTATETPSPSPSPTQSPTPTITATPTPTTTESPSPEQTPPNVEQPSQL